MGIGSGSEAEEEEEEEEGETHTSEAEEAEEEEQEENEYLPGACKRSVTSEDEEEKTIPSSNSPKETHGTKKKLKSEAEEAEEEEEEKQEENEYLPGACKRSVTSEDEEEKTIPSSNRPKETHGTKKKLKSKDDHTLSWIPTALANISSIDAHMLCHDVFTSHSSPKTCLSDLERVRGAAMALVNNTDAAISLAKARQSFLQRRNVAEKLMALRRELAQSVQLSRAESRKQAAEAKAELLKQKALFKKEKETLACSHELEREALIARYTDELSSLKRQLEEERDKSICGVCHEKPRDTIILPCLHFQYCFSCLLRHREANSNTCPTCRGPIQGLSMSSYLTSQ